MRKINKYFLMAVAVALVLNFSSNAMALFGKDKTEAEKKEEIQQEKADITKTVNETLAELYKLQPGAKSAISKSEGYAVFNNFGMKIFVAGSGSGKGILFDKKNKKQVFMKMFEARPKVFLPVG